MLDPEGAASFAGREGLDGLSLTDLAGHPAVLTAVDHDVAVANDGFPRAEQVRAFRLLDEEWPLDSELLTPTAKLKRRGLLAASRRRSTNSTPELTRSFPEDRRGPE